MQTSSLACFSHLVLTLSLALIIADPAGAWPNDPLTNVPVCTAAAVQDQTVMVPDGLDGAFIVWRDGRFGPVSQDIYAQRVLSSGVADPAWPTDGDVVCSAGDVQDSPSMVTDGAGGAIVAWVDQRNGIDSDIYVHHLTGTGVDATWPLNGQLLCGAAGDQLNPVIASDGAGGAIVAWQDMRGGSSSDIYAARVLASGTVDPMWPVGGRALCTAPQDQTLPSIASDGGGGAFVAWTDERSRAGAPPCTTACKDIYVQRVLGTGEVPRPWSADGTFLGGWIGDQIGPRIIPDEAGGAIVAWLDVPSGIRIYLQHLLSSGMDPAWPFNGLALPGTTADFEVIADGEGGAILTWAANFNIYAQRVLATGIVDPGWPGQGRLLCQATGTQQNPTIAVDGAGGAVVAWVDYRNGAGDIYAQRVWISGLVDPTWKPDGRAVSLATGLQWMPTIANGASGEVILVWLDDRGIDRDVYAQNIAPFGVLGDPEPLITSIVDVPGDQGRQVRIRWNASQMDTSPYYEIGSYGVWRQVTEAPALQAQALNRGAAHPEAGGSVGPGVFRQVRAAGQTTWWEGVGMIPARGQPWYTFVAGTFQDSTESGNPLTTFMVDAHATLVGWWDSAPDSGYSVDNLAPAGPGAFTGQYVSGTATLHWNPSVDHDFRDYRLYRGNTTSFVPDASHLIATLPDTGYVDAAGAPYVYKLTATDVNGNESSASTLEFSQTIGVGEHATPSELYLDAPAPNPACERVALRLGLPAAAPVRLVIYDAAGRTVRKVVRDIHAGGNYTEWWDLRDSAGRAVRAGLYFVRLEVGQRSLTRRVVVAR